MAELDVRHVEPPPSHDVPRDPQSEALRAERDVVHRQVGLGRQTVEADQLQRVPAWREELRRGAWQGKLKSHHPSNYPTTQPGQYILLVGPRMSYCDW